MRTLLTVFLLTLIASFAYAQDAPPTLEPISAANAAALQPLSPLPNPFGLAEGRVPYRFAISPDGTHIAVPGVIDVGGTQVDAIVVYGLADQVTTINSAQPEQELTLVGFVDAERLAYITDARSYQVVNFITSQVEISEPLPQGMFPVFDAVTDTTAGLAAFPLNNREIGVFDLATGAFRQVLSPDGDTLGFYSYAFTPDGRYLAAGDGDGFVYLWEIETGTLRQILAVPPLPDTIPLVSALAFSPDGAWLAIGSGQLYLWRYAGDISAPQQYTQLIGHTGNVTHLAFTAASDVLLSMSGAIENSDVSLRAWDLATQSQVFLYAGEQFGTFASFGLSPDDRQIITLSFAHELLTFGVPTP